MIYYDCKYQLLLVVVFLYFLSIVVPNLFYVLLESSEIVLNEFTPNPPIVFNICLLTFQLFIELSHIKRCFTQKGQLFVIEELGKLIN